MATLVYLSLSHIAPAQLAANCQLVSDKGRCQLRSPRQGRVLSDEPTATTEIDVLQLQVRSRGTAFPLI